MPGRCPKCGAAMKQQTTSKGALFLVCSKWPGCKVSGTPDLLAVMQPRDRALRKEVSKIGSLVTKLAQLRVLQSRLNQATPEERELIRQQAKELIRWG